MVADVGFETGEPGAVGEVVLSYGRIVGVASEVTVVVFIGNVVAQWNMMH